MRAFNNRLKPTQVPQINWGDPLADGLVFFCLFDHSYPLELVLQQRGVPTNGPVLRSYPDGRGMKYTAASSQSHSFGNMASYQPLGAVTVMALVMPDTSGATGSRQVISSSPGSNTTNTPFALRAQAQGVSKVGFVRASTGGYRSFDGPDVSLNAWHTIGAVSRTADITVAPLLFVDGNVATGTANANFPGSGTGNAAGSNAVLVGNRPDGTTAYGGGLAWAAVWNRALSVAEMLRMHVVPYSILRLGNQLSYRRARQYIISVVTGSLAITESSDTLSADADVLVQGSLAATESSDTIAAAAAVLVQGSLTVTEAIDTLTGAAVVSVTGSLAVTEPSDALAGAAAVPVTGTLAFAEAQDTLTGVGVTVVRGTLTVTEPSDAVAGASTIVVRGTMLATEAADALQGQVTIPVTGSLAVTEATDTLLATAVAYLYTDMYVRRVVAVLGDDRRVLLTSDEARALQAVLDQRWFGTIRGTRVLTARVEDKI